MHRLRLRPVPVPGLQQEVVAQRRSWRSTPSFAGRGPPATCGSPRQTPCLPWNFASNRRQFTATVFGYLRGFWRGGICRCLPLVATAGLHKGSIPRSGFRTTRCAVGFIDRGSRARLKRAMKWGSGLMIVNGGAYDVAVMVIPPRAFCLSVTRTLSLGRSSALATSSRILTARASQKAPSLRKPLR